MKYILSICTLLFALDGLAQARALSKALNDSPRAYALFAHCFTCGKDLRAAGRLATALTDAGFGVLRFDFSAE